MISTGGRSYSDKEADLFNLDCVYLLYDLTNSYFECGAKRNPKAKRSADSKEKP